MAPSCRYTLTPRADLAVFYAADSARYAGKPILELVTAEAFAAVYADCPSRGFACDGQPIGGLIFDGQEAHIAVLPQHHGRWATLLAPALRWLFELQPEMLIEIENDNHPSLAFMARNGWPALPGQRRADGSIAEGVTVFRVSARPERRHGGRLSR